jgi:hypothetical protein
MQNGLHNILKNERSTGKNSFLLKNNTEGDERWQETGK